MKNYNDIEKSLKRFLKRKVKITLGTIVAFLLGGSLSFADSLYIRDKENGIEFSTDNDFYYDENPYSENSYINNIYINNKNLDGEYGFVNSGSGISIINKGNINSDYVGFINIQDEFIGMVESITNKGKIITGSFDIDNYDIIAGFFNKEGQIKNFVNDSLIQADNYEISNALYNSNGYIGNLINNGKIVGNGNSEGTGIKNIYGSIDKIENNGKVQGYSQFEDSYGITNIEGTIGEIINNNIISSIGQMQNIGISNFNSEDNSIIGKIGYIENNGKIKVESSMLGIGIYNQGEIKEIKNNKLIEVKPQEYSDEDKAFGISNLGTINNIINDGIFKIIGDYRANGIYNSQDKGVINNIVNSGTINVKCIWDTAYGIDNPSGKIGNIFNSGVIKINGYEQSIGISNFKNGIIDNIINNGTMKVSSDEKAWGIDNAGGKITEIVNNGVFRVKGDTQASGIGNYTYIIKTEDEETGEEKEEKIGGIIDNITNNGMINILSDVETLQNDGGSWGIDNSGKKISKIVNNGIFKIKSKEQTIGIGNYGNGEIGNLINNGTIKVESTDDFTCGIYNNGKKISEIVNNGIFEVKGANSAYGIDINNKTGNLTNKGIIKVTGDTYSEGILSQSNEQNLINNGIVFSSARTFYLNPNNNKATNNGLLIGNSNMFIENKNSIKNGMMFSYDENNKNYKIYGIGENSDTVINAELLNEKNKDTPNWTADGSKSIDFTNKNEREKTFNGITDTLLIKGKNSLTNSTVNGYTNAVVFDKKGGELTLNNSIINGGIVEKTFAVRGQKGNDVLSLLNKTIINGNINLGTGDDKLTINNTVQLNGVLNGGKGIDNLTFNSSTKSLEENLNIRYNISGFENTTVDTKVTLFEKTLDNKGNVKNLTAQLGDITITKNGELTLRIDGTQKDDDTRKIIGHALYENNGLISSTGGKLLFALNGVKEGAIIDLGKTKLDKTMIGNDDINYSRDMTLDTTSLLHNITKIDSSSVKVSTAKNLPYVDIVNYNELNKIYQSLRSVDKVGSFNVDNDKKMTAFTKYLHDIYAGTPYAYSSELSRKTMGMMRDIADKDLHPDLKEWAIFGGLTHIDGGTEESYYGKGYYTYDIGSRDISADTKITGAYVKGEYGKAEDLTLGAILGGNSSETEIENSKVEGDSFYLGGYVKKYLNNFRFTLGAGIHRGDYEADRVAVGYDGITETRKFSENYGDRGFNLYGNVKYSQELGNGFYFEPSVTLDYSYIDQEGVKESGDLAIDVDSEKFDYTSGIVNLDIRKEFVGEKVKHSLIAGVSYERILSGEDEKHITGRFKGGTDFDILVPEKEKDNFALNVKYEVETEKGILFDVKGSYKFEHDSNKNQWIVGTGIGYRF